MSGIMSSMACYGSAPVGSRVFVVYPAVAGSWTVPAGVTSLTVEAVGVGGDVTHANAGLNGGGGGAYAKSIISVSSGQTIYYGANPATSVTIDSSTSVWINKSANSATTTAVDGVRASSGSVGRAKTAAPV